jgi:hypothetical protein
MFKKGKTNMIITIVLLIAIYILNIIDYLQSAYGIQELGLGIEANPVARFCFEHDILLPVKLIVPLILVLLTGFITIKIEPRFICVALCPLVLYVLVVWHNFIQLAQAGLLNLNPLEGDTMELQTVAITSLICTAILSGVVVGLLAYIKHLKITIEELEK